MQPVKTILVYLINQLCTKHYEVVLQGPVDAHAIRAPIFKNIWKYKSLCNFLSKLFFNFLFSQQKLGKHTYKLDVYTS